MVGRLELDELKGLYELKSCYDSMNDDSTILFFFPVWARETTWFLHKVIVLQTSYVKREIIFKLLTFKYQFQAPRSHISDCERHFTMLNVSFNRCAQLGFTCTLLDIKEPQQLPGVSAAVLAPTGVSVSGISPGEALLFVVLCTAPAQSCPMASACSLLLCH